VSSVIVFHFILLKAQFTLGGKTLREDEHTLQLSYSGPYTFKKNISQACCTAIQSKKNSSKLKHVSAV